MHYSAQTYRQSTRLDTAGFIASLLCAIHCAFMPLLLASLPLTGIKFLASPVFDLAMISFSFLIASISLFRGYANYHHKLGALFIVVAGFGLIAYGDLSGTQYAFILEASGAFLVALSHIVNHFLTRASLSK